MGEAELTRLLSRRPAVHLLCCGAYLQEPLILTPDLTAVPLEAIGFATELDYVASFLRQFLGEGIERPIYEKSIRDFARALPVFVISSFPALEAPPEELESLVARTQSRALDVMGWLSGDGATSFALITATRTAIHFRMTPPHSRGRMRLGFGNTGADNYARIDRILDTADSDERFRFVLSLLHDAAAEADPYFKIPRLFNCLEALAFRIKSAGYPSRKAVKFLIGLGDGPSAQTNVGGRTYIYDTIEIAGRVRDKLFHGSEFRPEDLNATARDAYDLYRDHPNILIEDLTAKVELEIARWANGVSNGLVKPPDLPPQTNPPSRSF